MNYADNPQGAHCQRRSPSAGRVAGKVVLVTGAARGQGQAHAIRLAREGADIIAVDLCAQLPHGIPHAGATEHDLAETAAAVEEVGGHIIARTADVRDLGQLSEIIDEGVSMFGHLDAVVANAGIYSLQTWDAVTPQLWRDTIDVNLTGTWNSAAVAIPYLISAGGGSIVMISSAAGIKAPPFLVPYAAAKHGVVGLAKALANELAPNQIRVNTVHPTSVETPMATGLSSLGGLLARYPDTTTFFRNGLPVSMISTDDVSAAVLFLVSDEARYVTGLPMTVDAGSTIR
jgi:SDR family mycofactocin-dependent oxidoreductase